MNATILNRDFQHPADGWYQIEPRGEHPNRPSGVVQVIDEEAASAIADRFNADADAGLLSHGHEMLIDHEHFKHDTDKETRAYGWLNRLESRADGIYGKIRWSATGKAAVDGGDYRFFSTEYDPADIKLLNTISPIRRIRPIRLDGLTLTNSPNNKGGKPITNRNPSTLNPQLSTNFRRGLVPAAGSKQQKQRTHMTSVATKLGLSAEASEEAVLAAVTKITNRVAELEPQVAPLTARITALEAENRTLLTEQIEADFATAGIKDEKIINRHKPLLADAKHFKNRAERVEFITDLKKPGAGSREQVKLTNRGTKPPTDEEATAGHGLPDQAKANKITNRATQLVKDTPNLSLATAYKMAANDIENAS